jgi:hypothetical protein
LSFDDAIENGTMKRACLLADRLGKTAAMKHISPSNKNVFPLYLLLLFNALAQLFHSHKNYFPLH